MITGDKAKFIDVAAFLLHLQRTSGSTLYIVSASGRFTGWLLTTELVVIPGFGYLDETEEEFTCYSSATVDSAPLKARLVSIAGKWIKDHERVALLKLEKPVSYPIHHLQTENCKPEDDVMVLQYPQGTRALQLSFGKIREVNDKWIAYDADTLPGSSGAPVINIQNGKLIAMHLLAGVGEKRYNSGVTTAGIIGFLRTTDYWPQIAAAHQLLDAKSILSKDLEFSQPTPQWDEIHYKAAVQWNIDPTVLSEEEKKALSPHLISKQTPVWALKPVDRQQILTSTSIDSLRNIESGIDNHQPGQKVIRRILNGGPYNLDEVDVEELPYWLQAVRWFKGIDETLPGPAEVDGILQKRRIRAALTNLGGAGFRGREEELNTLKTWYEDNRQGSIVISGIGGIGKTALISHFCLQLPENTLLLWLDFDRADLTPDDPQSILRILIGQIRVQRADFVAPPDNNDWKVMFKALGENLNKTQKALTPSLMVLDGFEVAQYAKQYQGIWELLNIILKECPSIKVIVSGRAAVASLKLADKPAASLRLTGMKIQDAEEVLEKNGLKNAAVIRKMATMSKGIPLILKLVIHYVNKGGDENELQHGLPKDTIEGYLYRRILYRVLDADLQPLIREALILRKITRDIINEILFSLLPANTTVDEVFDKLSKEMSLLEDGQEGLATIPGEEDVLKLRPELHTSTIRLLELEDAAYVRSVDQKAVDYYRKQDLSFHEHTAELVYHSLRLGNLQDAKKHWRPEIALYLKNSVEDLPEKNKAEKDWLKDMINQSLSETKDDIAIWESETYTILKESIARKSYSDSVRQILNHRKERSADSPLLIYDAWVTWQEGNLEAAIRLLKNSKTTEPRIRKDQLIFLALLETYNGNRAIADHYLSQINTDQWSNRQFGNTENLAVAAARMRLTVDLERELRVLQAIREEAGVKRMVLEQHILQRRDVVWPALIEVLDNRTDDNYVAAYQSLTDKEGRLKYETSGKFRLGMNASDIRSLNERNQSFIRSNAENTSSPVLFESIWYLLMLSEFRQKQLTDKDVLRDILEIATIPRKSMSTLEVAIVFSLTVFHGEEMPVLYKSFRSPSVDDLILNVASKYIQTGLPPLELRREELLTTYLRERNLSSNSNIQTQFLIDIIQRGNDADRQDIVRIIRNMRDEKLAAVIFYLVGPDPLEVLCKGLLGVGEESKLNAKQKITPTGMELEDLVDAVSKMPMDINDIMRYLLAEHVKVQMIDLSGSPRMIWLNVINYLVQNNQVNTLSDILRDLAKDNPQLLTTTERFTTLLR